MPFQNQIHIDVLLSELAVRYSSTDFIAEQVAPVLPVKKDSDKYRVYVRNFRLPETKRARKGRANEHYFEATTSSYLLEQHALKDYVGDDEAENWDINDLKADTTEELTEVIARRQEKTTADLFTTTSWSLNVSLAAANAFTANTTVSNPIPIFDTGATEVIQNSGMKPNVGVIPRTGYVGVKNHTSVLERIKYTSADITASMIAALFDLEKVVIPNSVYDSSAKGATESITEIWGDSAWLGYVNPKPSYKKPSALYTLKRNVPMVRTWRDEEIKAEAVEVEKIFQPKVVASLCGFLIKDIS